MPESCAPKADERQVSRISCLGRSGWCPIAERQCWATLERAGGTGELSVCGSEWLRNDARGVERYPQPADIDVGINPLADHLGQIHRAENRTIDLLGDRS